MAALAGGVEGKIAAPAFLFGFEQYLGEGGVLPQEQLTGNDYIVNIRIGYDIKKAFETDDVADTLNYAEVYNIVKEEMGVPSKLIEHVAGRIANRLMAEYAKITSIVLHITKCNPPMGADCQGAGVEIHVKR